jgi:hypothetical protein
LNSSISGFLQQRRESKIVLLNSKVGTKEAEKFCFNSALGLKTAMTAITTSCLTAKKPQLAAVTFSPETILNLSGFGF